MESQMYQKSTPKGCGCNNIKPSYEYPMNYSMYQCPGQNCPMSECKMDEYPMDDYNSESFPYNENSLESMPLGMAYVPWQRWNCVYDVNQGIQAGTIFPELELPFTGKKCSCGHGGNSQWK